MIPNKPENVPTEGVNGDVLILMFAWSYFSGRAPDDSPSLVRSKQSHLGSYGRVGKAATQWAAVTAKRNRRGLWEGAP